MKRVAPVSARMLSGPKRPAERLRLLKYTGSTNASDEACPLDERLGNLPAVIEACE
jgi:hypothetical protein